jgi:hypothetical protein
MASRYDQDRERNDRERGHESGSRPDWGNRDDWRERREWDQAGERGHEGRHERWRSGEHEGGRHSWDEHEGSRRSESRWDESGRGNEWRSEESGRRGNEGRWSNEGRSGNEGHMGGRNWGEARNEGNYEGRGWNPGRDLSYREPMTGIHRGEWSSGHGAGNWLGGSDSTAYNPSYARSGSYFGGQGEFGGGLGEYGDRGRHAGRGPKGYKRSDERIKEDVCERLTRDPEVDASEIEVQVKDGEVTLTGTVESRDQKRRAEDVIENVSGVREVNNQLRMHSGQTGETSGKTASASAGEKNRR